jgi:hypothetical protein
MASPRLGLAVAFVTARSFLEPGMIPIELAWLTAGRSRPSFPTFARDIVRLSVIKRGHRGRIGTIGRVDAKLEGDDLRLATGTAPVEYLNPWPVSEAATPRRVIWDNSSIGREINVPVRLRRSFSLFAGDDGVSELTALSELVRRRPRAVMKALVRPPLLLRLRRSALGRGLAGMKPRAERPDLP